MMQPESQDDKLPSSVHADAHFLDDVLNQTMDGGQGSEVVETLRKIQSELPNSRPDDLDTVTRFVHTYLKRIFPQLKMSNEKVLTMASTIAQSILEDPVASARFRTLWTQI